MNIYCFSNLKTEELYFCLDNEDFFLTKCNSIVHLVNIEILLTSSLHCHVLIPSINVFNKYIVTV